MEQLVKLQEEELKCRQMINQSSPPTDDIYCPPIWDGAYCWSHVPANTSAVVPCPSYIHGFNTQGTASRRCNIDGSWWIHEELNTTWTNYTLCEFENEFSVFTFHVPVIKLISQVGYSLSLLLLVVAFLILASVKKLRCPRNNLHMQLFLSFIMRAFLTLLRDILFVKGLGGSDAVCSEDEPCVISTETDNISCKIFTSFWLYFLMANYCWILMEGLYLHNLVFLSMFTDTSGILKYIIFGWGCPIFFIVPWIILKATMEDILCWTINKNPQIFWITRGPITASIIVNFIFFLNITRVLFLKMFSSQAIQSRRYRYRKWFRSTLVLVPLFGVHYAVLLFFSLAAEKNNIVELIWLYIDLSFSSFQGSFVALLYCFLNGEVQSELRKIWQRVHSQSSQPLRSHHSLLTQSLTYLSRGRSSVQSLHSTCADRKDNYKSNSPLYGCHLNDGKSCGMMHAISPSFINEDKFRLNHGDVHHRPNYVMPPNGVSSNQSSDEDRHDPESEALILAALDKKRAKVATQEKQKESKI